MAIRCMEDMYVEMANFAVIRMEVAVHGPWLTIRD